MRPSQHLALSAAAGGVLWPVTGEPGALPVTVAASVLVDLDHVWDLGWMITKRRKPMVTALFHGWEWLAVATAFCIALSYPWWLVAATVGYGLHIVADLWFNRRGLGTYSLVYRVVKSRGMSRPVRSSDVHGARRALRQKLTAGLQLVAWLQRRVRTRLAGGA